MFPWCLSTSTWIYIDNYTDYQINKRKTDNNCLNNNFYQFFSRISVLETLQ